MKPWAAFFAGLILAVPSLLSTVVLAHVDPEFHIEEDMREEYNFILVLIYIGIAALGIYMFRDYIGKMFNKPKRSKRR